MHSIHVLTALSALACAACAGLFSAQWGLVRFGHSPLLFFANLAVAGALQLLVQLEDDPGRALWWARAASLTWLALGPLFLGIFIRTAGRRAQRWRHVRAALSAMAGLGAVLAVSTSWVIESIEPTAWGYAVVPGPLFPVLWGLTFSGLGAGLWLRRHAMQGAGPERRDRRRASLAILGPLTVVAAGDVLLPVLGARLPVIFPLVFGPLALLVISMRVRQLATAEPGPLAGVEVLEILPDGVALLNDVGVIRQANDGLARLCEASPRELEGLALSELLRWEADDDSDLEVPGELLSLGGRTLPVSVRAAQYRDPFEGSMGRVVVVRDLRELSQLRGQLAVSARLAAVGELAAGIAHEINNPLAFVRANLSQLETSWKQLRPLAESASDPGHGELLTDCDELIEESLEGVDRAVEIVRGVKSFAHTGGAQHELCDLHPLLDEVLKIASTQLRGHVNVMREFDGSLHSVLGSPQQLKQVFLNLVVNAGQAVEEDGTVLVATRSEGPTVVVSVADDGCGIRSEHMDRLFDPFFTTKPVGEGTGLGLGISHKIVTSHGGEIEVESEPGQGSVFRVRLPAAAAEEG